jgi:ATP-dependent helicase/nuclease subunit B
MAAARARPHLWSIPAGVPFLDALAEAVLADRFGLGLARPSDDPAALAALTIYVPTRRAVRGLAHALQQRAGGGAMILPRLVPLGDPTEALVADALEEELRAGDSEALPVPPLTRQMLLASLLQAAGRAGSGAGTGLLSDSLGAAFALGGDLAAILDAMQAEETPFDRLGTLDASRFDAFWQTTAELMAILGAHWPAILAERGVCDPIAWRNRALDRQAAAIAGAERTDPIIVAGSTGSMPATARLMAAVARRPRGVVVLPDLDEAMGEADWRALSGLAARAPDRFASHPQAQLLRLLESLQAARADVQPLTAPLGPLAARRALLAEALRPAESTDAWASLPARLTEAAIADALAAVTLVEAPDERLEGLTIALIARELLDDPAATVAVVTPDRAVAERVTLDLARWGIAVDDSAGLPLARTGAGHLALLLADLAANGVSAALLLDIARHARARFGFTAEALAEAAAALEIGALRGTPPLARLDALSAVAAAIPARVADRHAPPPMRRLSAGAIAAAQRLAAALVATLGPLVAPGDTLAGRLAALIAVLEEATDAGGEAPLIFAGEDGEALRRLFEELGQAFAAVGPARADAFDLLVILRAAMAERPVRVKTRQHPRLMVLGALEARLISADHVILAGLNEGAWPPASVADPFLNRAMRAQLGLTSPERRIGQSAHDFTQAFLAPRVIVTRAAKVAGQEMLPSRFWLRLKAVTPPALWREAGARGEDWLAMAEALDRPAAIRACPRPKPFPPAALQPLRYSVTEVATLYRDPYAIFAGRILDLKPLEPLDNALGAKDRGELLHAVLERFTHRHPRALPDDPDAVFLALGREAFAPVWDEPDVAAFWWPRFVELVPAIVAFERERRAGARLVLAEMRVAAQLISPDGAAVTLTARADRVEERTDGRLALMDFKSGPPPSEKTIKQGLAPQLILEAALARRAAFKAVSPDAPLAEIGPAPVEGAAYVRLKLENERLKVSDVFGKQEAEATSEEHLAQFLALLDEHRRGARPFVSRFAPRSSAPDGPYDHLARVKEWSADGGGAEEEP